MEKRSIASHVYSEFEDQYQKFGLLSLSLLVIGMLLKTQKRKIMRRSKLFIICAFQCDFILYGQDEGLNNFNEEKFLQAENYYDILLLDDENNYKAHLVKAHPSIC